MKEKANEPRKIRSKEMRMVNREYDEIVFGTDRTDNPEDKNSLNKKKS